MSTDTARCVVRPARTEDAAAAVALLRASITACTLDHQNDPATLARWLANKTVDIFRSWLEGGNNQIMVAEFDGQLAGVALLANDQCIRLFYVDPAQQRLGIGRALLEKLESAARERGFDALDLMSTAGARPFYERLGYEKSGEPTAAFGVLTNFPYRKLL